MNRLVRLLAVCVAAIFLCVLIVWPSSESNAGSSFKDTYLTISGVPVRNYTKGDSTITTSDAIQCYGAKAVFLFLSTRYSQAYTTTDSAFSDSLNAADFLFSVDDTTYGAISNTQSRFCVLYQGDAIVASAIPLSMTGQSGPRMAAIVATPLNNTSVTSPFATIPMKYVKFRWRPANRNTFSGAVSTQGNRTKGLNSLTIRCRIYYDNP